VSRAAAGGEQVEGDVAGRVVAAADRGRVVQRHHADRAAGTGRRADRRRGLRSEERRVGQEGGGGGAAGVGVVERGRCPGSGVGGRWGGGCGGEGGPGYELGECLAVSGVAAGVVSRVAAGGEQVEGDVAGRVVAAADRGRVVQRHHADRAAGTGRRADRRRGL